jgi:hypothetical protein
MILSAKSSRVGRAFSLRHPATADKNAQADARELSRQVAAVPQGTCDCFFVG